MVHAKNVSITEKEKGFEVRFEVGFDKALPKGIKLGKEFPKIRVISFDFKATQTEIENRIKIEIARLENTLTGKMPKGKPAEKAKVDSMNAFFEGKQIK